MPYKDLEETVEKLLLSVFDTKDAPEPWPGARNQTENATRADLIKVLTHISAWTQDDEFSINSRVHYQGRNLCRYLLSIIPEDYFYLKRNALRCGILKYTSLMLINNRGQWREEYSVDHATRPCIPC
jgi:hypothetical protein